MKVESERSITVHITLQQEEASWLRDFLLKHSFGLNDGSGHIDRWEAGL